METDNRKYYAAYNERYKTAHAQGVSWSSNVSTPIVMEVIEKYNINRSQRLLEIGCGEGRDARTVLEDGFQLTATDISGSNRILQTKNAGICKSVQGAGLPLRRAGRKIRFHLCRCGAPYACAGRGQRRLLWLSPQPFVKWWNCTDLHHGRWGD